MLQPWIETLLDRMAVKLMNAAASRIEGQLEEGIASVKGELLAASLRYEATFGTQADDIRQRLSQVSSWLGCSQPFESSIVQTPENIEQMASLLLANSSPSSDTTTKLNGTSKTGKPRRKSDRSGPMTGMDTDRAPTAKRRRGRPKKNGSEGSSLSMETVESFGEKDQEVL